MGVILHRLYIPMSRNYILYNKFFAGLIIVLIKLYFCYLKGFFIPQSWDLLLWMSCAIYRLCLNCSRKKISDFGITGWDKWLFKFFSPHLLFYVINFIQDQLKWQVCSIHELSFIGQYLCSQTNKSFKNLRLWCEDKSFHWQNVQLSVFCLTICSLYLFI